MFVCMCVCQEMVLISEIQQHSFGAVADETPSLPRERCIVSSFIAFLVMQFSGMIIGGIFSGHEYGYCKAAFLASDVCSFVVLHAGIQTLLKLSLQ